MSVNGRRGKTAGGSSFDGADGVHSTLSPVVIAAHELKGPLALIRQLTFELERTGLTATEKADLSAQIRVVSERALRFSSNLTKAERVQASLFPTSPLRPESVIMEVRQELAPLYGVHARRLEYNYSKRLPLIVANRDLLRRILAGFADNALHYADEDGVVELYAQLLRRQSKVRLGVRDHGPALPNQLWQELLHASSRPQPVHARPASSGLGLHIGSQFARAIGSEIGATRHRDGASFYVDLPVSNQLKLI